MFKKAMTVTTIFLASSTAFAYALSESADFNTLDVDKDGVISKSEAVEFPKLIEHWAKLDANGDNELSLDEFKAVADL